MFCIYCGSSIDDSATFCPKCGKKIYGSKSTESVLIENAPKKKSRVPLLVSVIALCFIISAGGAAYFVLHMEKNKVADVETSEENKETENGEGENALSALFGGNSENEADILQEDAKQENVDEAALENGYANSTAVADSQEGQSNGSVDSFLRSSQPSDDTGSTVLASANNATGPGAEFNSSIGMENDLSENSDYLLPESNVRLYSEAELRKFSAEELRIARNEIYARYGRKFQDTELQRYFDNKSWYRAQYEPDEFDKFGNNVLSDIEKENAEIIKKVEETKS
ncbi:YARHG domain-containing protein [Butyrivibrio sp. AC2005]|uniref:YARHG domain-containing protein n=1 Tax=Butyrivibrio sp. AC2005 TaxID=1280672 RepID=UPI000412FD94|nr:YARHG domain-containing protein [Butyrivibrio sp. AC2005]